MEAVVALPVFLITTGVWLWMARANRGGRPWARITATALFGVLTVCELALLVDSLTGPVYFTAGYILLVSGCALYWLAGLSVVVLLWQRSSSDYYATAGNRSKAIRAAARKQP